MRDRDGVLVVKWDLAKGEPMKGEASSQVRKLIVELEEEDLL
jgi:hypothetical protein